MQFPDDDNGELLAEMAEQGVDLTQFHTVDFFILFEQQDHAQSFADAIQHDELAPSTKIQRCSDTGVWEVLTSIKMVPEHSLLTTTEQYLESLADKHHGYGDGWGILSDLNES